MAPNLKNVFLKKCYYRCWMSYRSVCKRMMKWWMSVDCGVDMLHTHDIVLFRSGPLCESEKRPPRSVIRRETRSDVILREGTCLENGGSSWVLHQIFTQVSVCVVRCSGSHFLFRVVVSVSYRFIKSFVYVSEVKYLWKVLDFHFVTCQT